MSNTPARISSRLALLLAVCCALVTGALGQNPLAPNSIQVSRIQYDGDSGNTYVSPFSFPEIFNDQTGCTGTTNNICNIAGIQGSVYIDQFSSVPEAPAAGTLALPSTGAAVTSDPVPEPGGYITSSFSSKSEGALMLSPNGNFLTYFGYMGNDMLDNVSNSYSLNPNYDLSPNTYTNGSGVPYPFYDREVALIGTSTSSQPGLISLTPIDNADSGDNPRAAITVDGNEIYTVGNSDSTTATPSTGPNNPGLTIGVRCAIPLNAVSYQLGNYSATDRPDESAKKHVKDNNWRAVGIYTDANGNQQLYVAKGSGSNGDDGVFQVGNPLPSCTLNGTDTKASFTPLFSAQATNPTNSNIVSPYVPFGFWFANPTTLYVADEGYQNTDSNGNLIPDPLAGLEKWTLVNGTWTLQYTITAGLNMYQPTSPAGYVDQNGNQILSYVTGLRNMTGHNNGDGTATIYAITANYSSVSSGEPDPTSLVGITDTIAATSMPANEQFVFLQTSGFQEVYRGVAYVPSTSARATQTVNFPSVGPLTYGASPVTLSASATSGWPVFYSLVSGPATLSGNVLTITGAGSVVVSATQTGNTDYASATTSQSITVNPASQAITFTVNAPASAAYGSSFTVAATGGASGNPVTFTSAGSCTNSGPNFTMTSGTGSCSVIANQLGNSNYSAANPVTESVAATQVATSIAVTSVNPTNEDYGLDSPVTINAVLTWTGNGAAPTGAVTIGGSGPSGYVPTTCATSGNSITCTASYTPTAADGAGTYTESASFAGDSNYSSSSSSQSNNFTINLATAATVVTADNNPSTFGQTVNFTATISGENGLLKGRTRKNGVKAQAVSGSVTWSSDTGCGTTAVTSGNPGVATCSTSILPGGSNAVTATYSGDSNHAGSSGSFNETVNPQSQTVTFTTNAPSTAIYNTSFTVAASASSGLAVTYTSSGSCSNSGALYTMTSGTGTCSVTATQSGNGNYSAATPVTQFVTAKPASQSITVTTPAPATEVYNGSFTVAASASSGLALTYTATGVCTNGGTSTYTMTAGGGTCTVKLSQAGNSNYTAASTITETTAASEATQSVTFTGAPTTPVPYLGTFTVSATTNAPITPIITTNSACSISGSIVTMETGSGTCTLTATWNGNGNYKLATATQSATAEKATPIVSWGTPSAITYPTPLSPTQLDASANTAGTFTYSPKSGAILGAGSDTLSVTFKPSNTNYTSAPATVTLQVLQQPTTTAITSGNQTVTLNRNGIATSIQKFNVGGYKPSGAVSVVASTGEVCSGNVSASTGDGSCKLTFANTGSRTVTATYSGDDNHSSSTTTQTVTITVN